MINFYAIKMGLGVAKYLKVFPKVSLISVLRYIGGEFSMSTAFGKVLHSVFQSLQGCWPIYTLFFPIHSLAKKLCNFFFSYIHNHDFLNLN